MTKDHKEFRAALCERRNNKTGAVEWALRFTHPATPLDHRKVLWLDGPPKGEWFTAEDHRWFYMAIGLRKNVAVKFADLRDAVAFLEVLRPAQVGEEPQTEIDVYVTDGEGASVGPVS